MVDNSILRRTLYCGGLDEEVDRQLLEDAFITFGVIKSVEIPLDVKSGKHRGFGFIEFENAEDAADAIDNKDKAELYGRTLKVCLARAPTNKPNEASNRPVWADDFFYRKKLADEGLEVDTEALQA